MKRISRPIVGFLGVCLTLSALNYAGARHWPNNALVAWHLYENSDKVVRTREYVDSPTIKLYYKKIIGLDHDQDGSLDYIAVFSRYDLRSASGDAFTPYWQTFTDEDNRIFSGLERILQTNVALND